ncbi:MAG TPA: hypothetical protein VFY55_09145 [Nitrososphaeraceae archaeon]|nr:hypothetical protein [Nitrososphaeraceae archaeon]
MLTGSILGPYSTIFSVFAKSSDGEDNKKKEVTSQSNKKEKSTGDEKSRKVGKDSSENSDEQDRPKKDELPKEREKPPEEEEPPEQESQPPTIITNTVTAPAVSSPSSDEDDEDDEDNNEGPTKFAFLDSFFTDQTAQGSVVAETSSESSAAQDIPPVTKQEVGAGEGDSVLAIVLINRGFSDVTSIRASLDFPSGFTANVSPKNIDNDTALASYNGLVDAGQTFTLYFPVTISKDTQVGKEYTGSLNIDYFNVAEKDEENMRDRSIKVPFKLSGKVILDAISFSSAMSSKSDNQTFQDKQSTFSNVVSLLPGEPNIVETLVKNEGSAAATGVIVEVSARNRQDQIDDNNVIPTTSNNGNDSITTVQQSTVIPLISAGTTTFNVGTIPAGESVQINPVIFASNSVGSILENIDLKISYNNAYGYKKTLDKSMGVHILPSSPQSGLTLSSTVTSETINNVPSLSENFNQNNDENNLVTNGNYGAKNKNLTYAITQVSEYSSNDNTFIPGLENNNTDRIGTSPNNNTVSLVAGRVDELQFNITNTNTNPIMDAVVSLVSESSSIKILGDSKWNLNEIDPYTTKQFLTRVFASKSLINSPVSFKVSIQYIYDNQAKSESFNLGANVKGDITVNINDLAVNYIGGNPNLVGNILNKGNTLALFTTIEISNPSSSSSLAEQSEGQLPQSFTQGSDNNEILIPASSFPQYLGDLEENSPLPFSIPLAINNNTSSGIYPVSLKVTYSDDLRNSYTIINNGSVEFVSPVTTSNKGQGILGNYDTLVIVVILAIIGTIAFIVVRRFKSKKKTGIQNIEPEHKEENGSNDNEKGNDEDIESLLGGEDSSYKENFQKK